jgi:hypothetical protein
MTYRVHSVIIVEDKGRNETTSLSRTNFQYQLTQPVKFYKRGRQYEYFCRIENVRIPISFYNINSNYDTYGWTGSTTGAVSFNITHGNYTIDELITEVQVQMNTLDANTYTITYDEITQKVNIASDGVENVSSLTGDGWQTLGFDLTETITGASNTDGNSIAYTNTTRHLRLHVDNLVSNNVYANDDDTIDGIKQTNLQRISLTIPITQTRNEFQFYDNHHGYFIKLPNMACISSLNVRLTDANNNSVDLNKVPWGFNCVIYKLKKAKY